MPLFKSIEEIRVYLPVNISFNFEDITPLLVSTEAEFIIDILGQITYIDLENNFSSNTLTPDQDDLLPLCQKAVAWLAYMKWVPIGNIHATAGGFQVVTGDGMAPASQWRVTDFAQECRKNGYNALQDILKYLWATDADTYPEWEDSDEYTKHRELLLLSPAEVNKYIDINNSVEVFRKLKPYILLSSENHIIPVIGQELYDEIKDEVATNTLTANNELLMRFIRPCLSNFAMANGCIRMMFELETYGIITKSKGTWDNMNNEKEAGNNLVSAFISMCRRDGTSYEEKLRQYLKENAATYPLYESSTAFEDIDEDDEDGSNMNDQDSGFYMI